MWIVFNLFLGYYAKGKATDNNDYFTKSIIRETGDSLNLDALAHKLIRLYKIEQENNNE